MIKAKNIAVSFALLFTAGAFGVGAFSGGDGSQAQPYEIAVKADLAELATLSESDSLDGKYFVQTADISLGNDTVTVAENANYPFMGSYDGMGWVISDAVLSGSGDGSGLFIYTKDAEISNITISDAVLCSATASGGIVARADGNTVISDCSFEGTATLSESGVLAVNIGGIVGKLGGEAEVIRCSSVMSAAVEKSPFIAYIGGIVGNNNGKISQCINSSALSANSGNYLASIGGIAGENCGIIEGCVSDGSVSGRITSNVAYLYLGGIVGSNDGGKIERTVNKGSVSGVGFGSYPGYIGGIVGFNVSGSVSTSLNGGILSGDVSYAGGVSGINYAFGGKSSISECLNTGKVTVSTGIIGGIVGSSITSTGEDDKSYISASMNLGDVTSGLGAIGSVSDSTQGSSHISGLIIRNTTDENAKTMTDSELIASTGIDSLTSSAWVYPDGFYPSLAVVADLTRVEIIATAIDEEGGRCAFTVYNPNEAFTATSVVSFYSGSRLIGTKISEITAENGYGVHSVSSGLISNADCVKIMLVDSLGTVSPLAQNVEF